MAFMFENLDVYRKAVDFIDQVTSLSEQFPRGYYFLANQLNRAAFSIATNLAEGNGRFTKANRRNFFIIARGYLLLNCKLTTDHRAVCPSPLQHPQPENVLIRLRR